jgi:hypothetical protein
MSPDNESVDPEGSDSRIGLFFRGNAQNESLALGICLGIQLDNEELQIQTMAGAPEFSYFDSLSFDEPLEARQTLIDVKRVMRESERGFYVDQAASSLRHFWSDFSGKICQLTRNLPRADAEKEIQNLISENFDPQLKSVSVKLIDFERIQFTCQSSKENSEEKTSQSDETETDQPKSDRSPRLSRSIHRIEPVLDVNDGIEVNKLEPGMEISVRLTGRTASRVKKRVSKRPHFKLPPLPATVLSVDRESESDNYTIITELQKGIYGIAKVQPGSKVETNFDLSEEHEESYESYLNALSWIIVTWIILLGIFVFLIIY